MRGDDRNFREDPIEWRELKDFIVDQVRRAGNRIDSAYVKDVIRERGGDVDRVLDKLAKKGFLKPAGHDAPAPTWTPPHRRSNVSRSGRTEGTFDFFRDFRKRLLRRVERGFTGLRVHATAYAGAGVLFFLLWLFTGAGHPWFLYPMGAWAIGLLNHANPVFQRLRQRREIESLPDLNRDETRYLQRYFKRRTGFAAHFVSSAGLSLFLGMVDVITGGFFPWALIPTAVLGFGLLLHWSAYGPKGKRMRREIRGWIDGTGSTIGTDTSEIIDGGPAPLTGGDLPVVQEASGLRRTILRQIEEMEKDHPNIGEDMRSSLDTYFNQVSLLAKKSQDIDRLLVEMPRTGLEQDRMRLKNRMESVESDRLREEYEKSILQVDRQLASIKELAHHSEMLDLRLTSAVNLMKQLQLDLARVKGASLTSTTSVDLIKEKSDELSAYLKDLEAGYDELESDL